MLLRWLDQLAGWWLDWRTDQAVQQNPDLQEFGLKKVDVLENGLTACRRPLRI
ncbi:MAG TPA: hypothetical protein PKE45_21900 [Caldilineaceae bacterium]|nr:hypothetical protein [Caldilineaceae bacterium]